MSSSSSDGGERRKHSKKRARREDSRKSRKRSDGESAALSKLLSRPDKLITETLKWCRRGKASRLAELFSALGRDGTATLLKVTDAQGQTPLHQACQCGHQDVVGLLLRQGADAEAQDRQGRTPAHTAADAGHLLVLQQLLQSDRPPDPSLRDVRGVSIEQVVERALARDGAAQRAGGGGGGGSSRHHEDEDDEDDDENEKEEERWRRRLREEASDDDFGGGAAADDGWQGAGRNAGYGGEEGEGDEAWADRMWAEMQARRRAQARASARSFASTFAEQRAAEEARRAAQHAETLSRLEAAQRLLREEQARDQQWRQRAAGGPQLLLEDGQAGAAAALPALDPAAAYQQYTSRWAELERRMAGGAGAPAGGAAEAGEDEEGPTLALAQLPWPLPEGYPYTLDNLREVLLAGVQSASDIRQRLRAEVLRWHPDKFLSRFSRALRPGAEREAALQRCKEVSQALTHMMAGRA